MLVLTRKENETILIGEDIRITVLGITGDKVRLGIDAPRTVRVLRLETIEQSRQENQAAAAHINLEGLIRLKDKK